MTVCAVGVEGQLWCWGGNERGRMGTGDLLKGMMPRRAAEGYLFTKVSESPGGAFTCGITTGGQGYCWGSQNGGRLGNGDMGMSMDHVTSPVAVMGERTYIDIAAGGDHACAIATGGAAYCWGYNTSGQLGTGNNTNSSVPVAVTGGLTFTSITAWQMITCGITSDGSAYCWGNGSDGALGTGTGSQNNSQDSSNVPVAVKGGLKFASLQLGTWHACGVTIDGDGYCWGYQGNGELGMGSMTPNFMYEPAKVVGGHKWKSISPGVSVTCGVTTAGGGFCWGGNWFGERGTGAFPAADIASPAPVVGDLKFDSIDTDWCSCGVAEGVAYCWGPGSEGCIGDGALVDRGIPTKVAGQP